MADWSAVVARFHWTPPTLFQQLHDEGCCDPFHPKCLQFSDLHWLSPEQIAAWVFPRDHIGGLVPFATTSNMDLWCFYPAAGDGGEAPIVYCPDEDEVAFFHAPDLKAAIYRWLLEELTCTGLTEHLDVRQSHAVLTSFVDRSSAWLPEPWHKRLVSLADLPWHEDNNGYHGALDPDDALAILRSDLNWPRLDEEFAHYRGN